MTVAQHGMLGEKNVETPEPSIACWAIFSRPGKPGLFPFATLQCPIWRKQTAGRSTSAQQHLPVDHWVQMYADWLHQLGLT
jgi:hypothetical protein